MKPGIIVWVLGNRDRLGESGLTVKTAISEHFPFSIILSEEEVREHLCGDVKQDEDARKLAAERAGWVCGLLARGGGAGIVLSHSSRRDVRDAVRKASGAMIEVLVAGDAENLEPPYYPEVEVAGDDSREQVSKKLLEALKSIGLLDEPSREYDEEEERLVKERLEKLGYL
ncbi:MAG: adenylyl-sulfate kinase [Pseudomonadota bacterium]